MSLSDSPGFKDALEQFCEEWDINYALLLLPSEKGDVGLMGVNLNREQIVKLLKVMHDNSAQLPKKRLDS